LRRWIVAKDQFHIGGFCCIIHPPGHWLGGITALIFTQDLWPQQMGSANHRDRGLFRRVQQQAGKKE
jgi:hypothetical protein